MLGKRISNLYQKAKKGAKLALEPVRLYRKDRSFRIRTFYSYYYQKEKIDEKAILYESYHGNSISCNPYAIFIELLNSPDFSDFTHYWVVSSYNEELISKYNNKKNVKFILRNSKKYLKLLCSAKYLVNNVTFPNYFQKKPGQIYINLWHGTPIKTLGKDIVKSKINAHKNVQRNFLHCDYIVSPNEYTTKIILDSYDINGIYENYIIESGYPRIDLMFKQDKEDMKKKLNIPSDKKVILYAPTWRGGSDVYNDIDTSHAIYEDFTRIKEQVSNEYYVLIKAHHFAYKHLEKNGLKEYCVPFWIDTNELLSVVDILITDYSSIWFDILPKGSPVLFYMNDLQDYLQDRGLYLQPEELPGPVSYTIDDLIKNINNIDSIKQKYSLAYANAINKYCKYEDGAATKRVVDLVFRKKHDIHINCFKVKTDKTKLFMYCGSFIPNGITSSAINLLNSIDYSTYDVTILFGGNITPEVEDNIRKVPSDVKFIYRDGTFNFTYLEYIRHRIVPFLGLKRKWVNKLIPKNLYRKEFKRMVGDSKFDIGVDFGGYSPMWMFIMLYNDFKKKYVYLHSNMMADANRKVNGKKPLKQNFNVIFYLYKEFDKLISVSKDSMEVNKLNLAKYGVSDKIVFVNNAIDYERIIESSKEITNILIDQRELIVIDEADKNGLKTIKAIEAPRQENVNFVTVGRLSPEKDQLKLVKAFSKINKLHPNTRLYIIGDGPLRGEIEKQIINLNLTETVILTGHLSNPAALVKKCDCFVLSSNYEGQPVVLLEALILGKPIVATNVTGVRDVLEGGYGELVENSEAGLIMGMEKFILKQVKFKHFDYIHYNKNAMDLFYREVCSLD